MGNSGTDTLRFMDQPGIGVEDAVVYLLHRSRLHTPNSALSFSSSGWTHQISAADSSSFQMIQLSSDVYPRGKIWRTGRSTSEWTEPPAHQCQKRQRRWWSIPGSSNCTGEDPEFSNKLDWTHNTDVLYRLALPVLWASCGGGEGRMSADVNHGEPLSPPWEPEADWLHHGATQDTTVGHLFQLLLNFTSRH